MRIIVTVLVVRERKISYYNWNFLLKKTFNSWRDCFSFDFYFNAFPEVSLFIMPISISLSSVYFSSEEIPYSYFFSLQSVSMWLNAVYRTQKGYFFSFSGKTNTNHPVYENYSGDYAMPKSRGKINTPRNLIRSSQKAAATSTPTIKRFRRLRARDKGDCSRSACSRLFSFTSPRRRLSPPWAEFPF